MTETSYSTLLARLLAKLGVTRAVGWTLMAQGMRLLTGPLTMVLMLRFLDADTQGYFYTFGSVLAISVFLEMGFSQNILQFTAHEFSKLKFDDSGQLCGDREALSRLISLGRLSFKYYAFATIGFLLILTVGGSWFFSTSRQVGVVWHGPWAIICLSGSLSLLLNPCWAILEGCNKIPEVEKYRFYSAIGGFLGLAIGLSCGLKLYAVCLSGMITLTLSIAYLLLRWGSFFKIFLRRAEHGVVSWRKEIWPFQWRVAVSWMAGYFIFSIITPVVFRIASPEAAGRIGFTLQLTRLIATVATSWSTSRLPEFGMLVAKCNWEHLAVVWRKSTLMNIAVTAVGSISMILTMEVLSHFMPHLALRYGGWIAALCFAISSVVQASISSFAYYLRAFKEEPYMILSVINAIVSFICIVLFTSFWQIEGAAVGYMLSILIVFPFAWRIFRSKRQEFIEARNVGLNL